MSKSAARYRAFLLPYVAVLVGLYVLSSAWVAVLIYHLGIVFFMACRGRLPSWKQLFLGTKRGLLLSTVICCLLSGPLVFGLWKFIALDVAVDPGAILALYGLSNTSWVYFMLYFVVMNPLLEELFWRHYLNSGYAKLSVDDIAFAGYHVLVLLLFIKLPWVFLAFCTLAISGWLWRRLSVDLQGLAVPWISHTVADASILLAVNALRA